MSDSEYRYHQSGFPAPPVTVRHISLIFDIRETKTRVTAETLFTVRAATLQTLPLNAKNLGIHRVHLNGKPAKYQYHGDILEIRLPSLLNQGAQITLTTITTCRPHRTYS